VASEDTYIRYEYVYVESFVTPVASFTKKYQTTDTGCVYVIAKLQIL